MANKQFSRGLVPIGDKRKTVVRWLTKGTGELFVGSAAYISAGVVIPTTTGATCTGSVMAMKNSLGENVGSLASAATGKVGITTNLDQEFEVQFNDETNFAGDADIGKTYDLTAETATVATATALGSGRSKRMLDGSTEDASTGTFKVVSTGRTVDSSTNAAAYNTVIVKINATGSGS